MPDRSRPKGGAAAVALAPPACESPGASDGAGDVDSGSLAEANARLGAFASGVAHDLRSRLATIGMSLAALEGSCSQQLGEEDLALLAGARALVGEMDDVLTGHVLLAFARHRNPVRQPVDISMLAAREAGGLLLSWPDREVDLEIEPGMAAYADPDLVRLAICQLLDNALRYTSTRAHASIRVGRVRDGKEQVFFVSDNGVGFNMADAQRMFEPFERLHADMIPGSGLGLAIVKQVVVRHGGWITATSKVGVGATFAFSLAPSLHVAQDKRRTSSSRRVRRSRSKTCLDVSSC